MESNPLIHLGKPFSTTRGDAEHLLLRDREPGAVVLQSLIKADDIPAVPSRYEFASVGDERPPLAR